MRAIIVVSALAALLPAGAALAQVQPLPATGRSESQATSINRSLAAEGQSRQIQQQNQIEVNSLRNELSRPAAPPPVVAPIVPGPGVVGR